MTPRRGPSPRAAAPAALAAGAVAGLIAVAAPVPHAQAAPTRCASTQVTVIVVGQGTGCARAGLTGTDSLRDAGFSVTKVQTQPGFVCRINGAPADDPCVRTPPASAYWAYYHAPLGGEWTYSRLGADNRRAPAGTVEAWAFGDGARPGAVPDAPAAPPTTTRAEPTSTRTRPPATPRSTTSRPAPRVEPTSTRTRTPAPGPVAPGDAGAGGVEPAGPVGEGAGIGDPPPADPPGQSPPEGRPDSPGGGAAPAELPPIGPGTPVDEGNPVEEGDPAEEPGAEPGTEPVADDQAGAVTSDDGTDALAADTGPDRSSPWPYVAVGGLLAALAAAGFLAARRFRG